MTSAKTKAFARNVAPGALLGLVISKRVSPGYRRAAAAALASTWTALHLRYRRWGRAETARQWELLGAVDQEALDRHYELVPTVEEEFELWGEYHRHRHEMRYDLVADLVRFHLPRHGTLLDVGCGAALLADRLADVDARYLGIDSGDHQVTYAAKRLRDRRSGSLSWLVARAPAELLPLADGSCDVVAMSEVIEHLVRPEVAVWEVARVLRAGGVFVMTTNNASEAPLRSPLSHPLAYLEKALGYQWPQLVSLRPWVWPEPVPADQLRPGRGPVHVPHTHHIQAETRRLLDAAGLETIHASTFEFPPPQSRTTAWLETRGPEGRRLTDGIEATCRRVPLLRRLGTHLLMVARRTGTPVAPAPPPGIWPGPHSP
jgi:SAM-dependent methyltransferase